MAFRNPGPEQIVITCAKSPTNPIEWRSPASLRYEAMRWSAVLRNRRRWADADDALLEQSRNLQELGRRQLGATEHDLRQIAQAGIAEVAMPYSAEDREWAPRVFPWEHALAIATRELRGGSPLTVVRRLNRLDAPPVPARPINKVLFVENTPGQVGLGFDFEPELRLVQEAFSDSGEVLHLHNPTLGELVENLRIESPSVLHIAGFDTHQAWEILHMPDEEHDGLCMSGTDTTYHFVKPKDLAIALRSAGGAPPMLTCFNVYNSAARLAALVVGEGASHSAIGFQDSYSDSRAERFFAGLYARLSEQRPLAAAFEQAWLDVRRVMGRTAGSGVVLWSCAPLLAPLVGGGVAAASGTPSTGSAKAAATPPAPAARTLKPAPAAPPTSVNLREHCQPVLKEIKALNYSMLHNRQHLFERLELQNNSESPLRDVHTLVRLNLGTSALEYSTTRDVPSKDRLDLTGEVVLPLTSELMRSLSESVRATMSVRVTTPEVLLCDRTYDVDLLAVDEWRDEFPDRAWLPSFVLPRDKAVRTIIDAAQKPLYALCDDSTAGFDGYQSVEEPAEPIDPTSSRNLPDTTPVDDQVKAIWWALVSDYRLAYVNPPPTYTKNSQRLRSPSDILAGRRGTCIDLALLLAACLEYVNIYPTIILLEGHAFPAYWRLESSYRAFSRALSAGALGSAAGSDRPSPEMAHDVAHGAGRANPYAWLIPADQYSEVLACIRAGTLVPLETVGLTQGLSFSEALEEGRANMRSRAEFNCLLDVQIARERGVTPLPLCGGAT